MKRARPLAEVKGAPLAAAARGGQRGRAGGGAAMIWLAGAIVFVALLVGLSEGSNALLWPLIPMGALSVLWMVCAAGLGDVILRALCVRQVVQDRSIALHIASAGGIGLGAMSLIALGLGLAGRLNHATAIALLTVGFICGAVTVGYQIGRGRRGEVVAGDAINDESDLLDPRSARPGGHNHWLWLIGVPFLSIATLGALVPPGILWGDEPNGYDVVEYHLQVPREWYEAGRIIPLEHNVFSYFPFNVEMHYLLAMHVCGGPWAGMYLCQLLHIWLFILSGLAIGGFFFDRKAALLAGLAAVTAPWLTLLAPVAYNEGGLLLFGTLALIFALLALANAAALRCWALAGIFAGFACGAKLTAAPMLLVGIPVAVLLAALFKGRAVTPAQGPVHGFRKTILGLAVFAVCGMIVFSPWMIRNAVWTGNPVFPEATGVFSRAHWTQTQVERWHAANHAPPPADQTLVHRVSSLAQQVIFDWRYGCVLIPLALLGGYLTRHQRETRVLLILLLFIASFWTFFTHLQSRFMVMSIPIAAILIGTAPWRQWWPAVTGVVVLGAMLSFAHLQDRVRYIGSGRWPIATPGLLGPDNFSWELPADISGLPKDAHVALAGDARAFLYPMHMSGLNYRTVFDVQGTETDDTLTPWLAPLTQEDAQRYWTVVDPAEIRRFQSSYWKIPRLPPAYQSHDVPTPIVIPPSR